ncbi:hypothetical protein ZOSMA_40G00610 [Zostera marina]|uniref:Pentatricopeptide repeat-containing protein n=1 Tax=Zostera marina TaxID=29655 RepID=A0A0K9P5G0_ZOSMR|nr:hypothetical protein ZOSMA_40G00610 [Zostera marina]
MRPEGKNGGGGQGWPTSTGFLPPRCQQLKEALARAVSANSFSLNHLRRVHARVIVSGFGRNLHLCSLLVRFYFSFQHIDAALRLFHAQCPATINTLLWNTLMRGFLTNGDARSVIQIYKNMNGRYGGGGGCLSQPDNQTLNLAITACTKLSEFEIGNHISDDARTSGYASDLFVGTALVVFHCKAGELVVAREVFDGMSKKDEVAWNAMISGYSQFGWLRNAVILFNNMRQVHGLSPTETSPASLVSACADLKILRPDAISWSTIISGYVEQGFSDIAIKFFFDMVSMNNKIVPTRPILLAILYACGDSGNWTLGRSIETKYLNLKNDPVLETCLSAAVVYMHTKCGHAEFALKILDKAHDVLVWNAAIRGCAELGQLNTSLLIILRMQIYGVNPDSVTFLILIPLHSHQTGRSIHGFVSKKGFASNRLIMNALIDMYSRSGDIKASCKVFDEIPIKDVISWSSLVKAYAHNGEEDQALVLFNQMANESSMKPNHITLISILTACCHAGYVERGLEIYRSMEEKFGIKPSIEHLGCVIDLLCRAGRLSEATELLESDGDKSINSAVLWGSLLNGCRKSGNQSVGELAARHLFDLEPRNAGNYMILAGIYTGTGKIDDAKAVLKLLKSKSVKKIISGHSWIEKG